PWWSDERGRASSGAPLMTAEAQAQATLPGGDLLDRPPGGPVRALDWLRRNLFSSTTNTLLTLLVLGLLWLVGPPFFDWAIPHAAIPGDSRDACTGDGACWTFIRLGLHTFFWGHYPDGELWRLVAAAALMVAFALPVMRERTRHRGLFVVLLLTLFPL